MTALRLIRDDATDLPPVARGRVLGTVERAWERLLDDYAIASPLRESSTALHTMHCRDLMRRTGLGPDELDTAALIVWLTTPGWSARTRKQHRASAAAVFCWARKAGLVATNPLEGVYASQLPPPAPVTAADVAAANAAELASSPTLALAPVPDGNVRTEHSARAWARAAGYPHAPTGRLSAQLLDAWRAAGSPSPALTGDTPEARWEELLDAFNTEARARGNRPSTINHRRRRCEQFGRTTGLDPADVTRTDLVEWIAAEHWAPETRAGARSALSTVLTFAYESGRIAHNPAARLPSVRVPRGAARPASEIAIRDAVNRASPRVRLMLLLAAYQGLRRMEIAGLHTDDLTDSGLHIVGKGGVERIVPLHPSMAAELDVHLGPGITTSGWLFPNEDGSDHLTPESVGRSMSRRLPRGVSGHQLRHRFATKAYAATYDIRSVQELLGHSSPTVTARYTAAPEAGLISTVLAVPPIPGVRQPAAAGSGRHSQQTQGNP